MRYLSLKDTDVTEEGVTKLEDFLPDCSISYGITKVLVTFPSFTGRAGLNYAADS